MKTILLTQGFVAIVSKADFKKISKYSWRVSKSSGVNRKKGQPYAATTIDKKKVYLHRFLMDQPRGLQVDHINRQTLDNRRENLRVCTPKENNKNRSNSK